MKKRIVFSAVMTIAGLLSSDLTHACSDMLNTLIYNAVRPVIESSQLCSELKKDFPIYINIPFVGERLLKRVTVGIDKTDQVKLSQFQYCVNGTTSTLKANIFVRCKTSDEAVIRTHIQEDFVMEATIDNATCKITEFHSSPRGDIGILIARNTGFLGEARKAMQDNLNILCGG